jgi:soluble lytic murein transglycosylase-like protein
LPASCRTGAPLTLRARLIGLPPLRVAGLLALLVVAAVPARLTRLPLPPPPPVVASSTEARAIERFLAARTAGAIAPPLRSLLARAIVEEADRASLDPRFVLALMEVESDFRVDARSNRDAEGLMQLRADTRSHVARLEGIPLDGLEPAPVTDVRLGVRYFARLSARYRRLDHALAAWNAGPGALDRELREEGRVPERWRPFARAVRSEHRKLVRDLDLTGGALASAPASPGALRAE